MRFFVGLDDLYYAFRFDECFISVNRLRDRVSDFAVNDWILDSGAFTELSMHGRYRSPVEEYARHINRWMTCGNMLAAVTQDYMCEPFIVEKTGLNVEEHQLRTIHRYQSLVGMTPAYIMPVLQGFKPTEYIQHIRRYGSLLAHGAWCGVGSICKRNSHPAIIEYILRGIKRERPDLRLHGFGLKITALNRPEIRALLHSADSMAWSFNARKNGRSAHDWTQAEAYRQRVVTGNTFDNGAFKLRAVSARCANLWA